MMRRTGRRPFDASDTQLRGGRSRGETAMKGTHFWRTGAAALLVTGGVIAMGGTATAASGDLDPTSGGDGIATAPLDSGA
jgi:hypothetical protein